jgi:hypothetical protein
MAGVLAAVLAAAPGWGAARVVPSVGGGGGLHFWAEASVDMSRQAAPARALGELRFLYSREASVLTEFQDVNGLRVYGPEATGCLWSLQTAIARREQLLGVAPESWNLPEGTLAINPEDYPQPATVIAAVGRVVAPEGALQGLPVFLAPVRSPNIESQATSYGAPWMDEALLLFADTDPQAVLHELGHVMHRQVLKGLPALDDYLAARARGKVVNGNAWLDSAAENFAEDYRTAMAGGDNRRGAWGPLTGEERARLARLVAAGRRPAPAPEFALTDGVATRRWQPLTGLQFVTDRQQVALLAQAGAPVFKGELCGASGCTQIDGAMPLTLALPETGAYTLTITQGPDVWLTASISRVEASSGLEQAAMASAQPGVCPLDGAGGPPASDLLRWLADREGWGPFPLPPERLLLGNGWDQDPAGPLLRWARLTGTVDSRFAWTYRPRDRVTDPAAMALLCPADKEKGPPATPATLSCAPGMGADLVVKVHCGRGSTSPLA